MLARKGEYAFNLESGVSIEVEGEYIVFRTPEGVSRRVHFGDNPSAEAAFEKIIEEYGKVIDLDIVPKKIADKFVIGDD